MPQVSNGSLPLQLPLKQPAVAPMSYGGFQPSPAPRVQYSYSNSTSTPMELQVTHQQCSGIYILNSYYIPLISAFHYTIIQLQLWLPHHKLEVVHHTKSSLKSTCSIAAGRKMLTMCSTRTRSKQDDTRRQCMYLSWALRRVTSAKHKRKQGTMQQEKHCLN